MINGSGWAWTRVKGRGDSLGYEGGRGQSRGLVNGFMLLGGIRFQGGYNRGKYGSRRNGMRKEWVCNKVGARVGGRDEGVDKWVVRGVFRGVSISKPRKSGK